MTTITLPRSEESRAEQFAETLMGSCLAAMELAAVELGERLGLYDALAREGGCTAGQLAAATGVAERYAREWLEQQAVAGVLEVEDPARDASVRRFLLPPAHAHVLLDEDSELCMRPAAAVVPWVSRAVQLMQDEYRRGSGVDFGAFGLHDIQAAFTRPVFLHHLTQSWLPALPDLQAKLDAGVPVRVAEVGCGEGVAAVTLARAYPHVQVDGYDVDEASVSAARATAAKAGVADRVRFHLEDAAEAAGKGDYDLAMAIEMLHDVPDPVGVLSAMRRMAGGDGAVLVVDELTEDRFTVPAGPMERVFYAFSTLHCLAVSMQGSGAGTGTVLRADTVRDLALRAGFADVEILPVEHPQFRLYRLR